MKKAILICISFITLLAFPISAFAAVAFDNATGSLIASITGSGGTSSFSFAVASTNPTIVLFVCFGAGTDTDSSATFNGVSMTKLSSEAGAAKCNSFTLTGQSGTHNIVITNNAVASRSFRVGVISYTGTQQSPVYSGGGQTDAFNSSHATSVNISQSVTTIKDNSWVAAAGYDDNRAPAVGTNVTARSVGTSDLMKDGDNNAVVHPAGSLSQQFTSGGNSDPLVEMQVTVSPAPASATASPDDGFIQFN